MVKTPQTHPFPSATTLEKKRIEDGSANPSIAQSPRIGEVAATARSQKAVSISRLLRGSK
jgi:hypothetical protein